MELIAASMARKATVVGGFFKRHVQKVLVLGMPVLVPEEVRESFDAILTAETVFFGQNLQRAVQAMAG